MGMEIPDRELKEGVPVVCVVDGEMVVVVRAAGQAHAVGATCTHYGGPRDVGIVDGGTIRCPWHHACFDLASGKAHGPALAPIACYDVVLENGTIRVGAKKQIAAPAATGPSRIVIIGGGAAGVACAAALRAEGFRGSLTLLAGEGTDPVDRPNLSKDFLAGSAPEEWVYLRTGDALASIAGEVLRESAMSIERTGKVVRP